MRLLAILALLIAAPAAADPVTDTRQILAGTVTTPKIQREYLSGARDGTSQFKGALTVVKQLYYPAPAPTTPIPAPTNPLIGKASIADNFNTAAGIEVYDPTGQAGKLPGESVEQVGAFRMRCNAGEIAKVDQIVYPGGVSPHWHQFIGNTHISAFNNYETLRTTGGSTCGDTNAPVNRTQMWLPAMRDGVGNFVKPDYVNVYYKQIPAAECFKFAAKGCVGLPHGIRAVFGYDMTTGTGGPTDPNSHAYWAFQYNCYKSDDDQTPFVSGRFRSLQQLSDAKACPVGARMQITFNVPGCWDGVNLDTPNHRSHLSWGTPETGGQVCPASHPYLITPWQGQIKYTVDVNFGTWSLDSDMAGVERGSSLHLDYDEAWSPTIKARWQKNCIDAHKSCSSGDLGDGFWIKQTPVTAPGQKVPL